MQPIVHGDYKIKLSKEYNRQGVHVKIFEPEYNEIQQKERDSYIIAGLQRILNDHANKNIE